MTGKMDWARVEYKLARKAFDIPSTPLPPRKEASEEKGSGKTTSAEAVPSLQPACAT
jgi:hypothetical protein